MTSPGRFVIPPSDACGVQPVKADGSLWTCSFSDYFNGTSLGSSWVPQQDPGNGADLCYASSPQTISVSGGALHLAAVRTGTGTECPPRADGTRATYAASSVSTWNTFGQQYGRFEARIRTPADNTPGVHAGFWLWPDTRTASDANWPTTGEIDIAEIYSFRSDLALPFLHYSADAQGPVDGLNTSHLGAITPGAWHTYALTWSADRLQISVDGRTILTNTSGAASFRKAFIVCLTQLLGTGTNAWTAATPLPASVDVDYVKVWK
jgi:beta-glucanase (GH16 family)